MAFIIPSPNAKLNPSPLPSAPHKRTLNSSLRFKCKLPISQYFISNHLQSRIRNPICKYGVLANSHNEKTRKTRFSASMAELSSHRIWLSDVVVKRAKNVFSGRKWNSLDVATSSMVVMMHGLALFTPFAFNWGAFLVAFLLYLATGLLGICLSFHRNLSHRSFKLPKWLEYFCAYCGVLALQCGEPSNVGDLEKQPFYRFMRNTYIMHPLALGVLLYAFGGFPYLVWRMGARTIWVYHITWLVNSACHVWGTQAWNTGDLSRNSW